MNKLCAKCNKEKEFTLLEIVKKDDSVDNFCIDCVLKHTQAIKNILGEKRFHEVYNSI